MLSDLITDAGRRVRSWGHRITTLAEPVEEFEAWLTERNLDFWELADERERIGNLLRMNREAERSRCREIDRLAAMYWKATGKWPKGHPQKTTSYGFEYTNVEDARRAGLPEGATGMRVFSNVPMGSDRLVPPPKAKLIPMNRYGEKIDLSEVDGEGG